MKIINNHKKSLLRYSIISELIAQINQNPIKNKEKFYREAATKTYFFDNKYVNVSAASIKKWYICYTKFGYDGLIDKIRTREATNLKISSLVYQQIINLLDEFPKITAKEIYRKLFEANFIHSSSVTYCTIAKYVKKAKLEINYPKRNRLSWEKAFAGDCIQVDTFKGPILKVGNKSRKTYIISLIDDASRYIISAGVYFNDNACNFQKTLKVALQTHGLFKQLYMDNGSPYRNGFTPQICAKLGINCTYTKIYDPSAKGKIERYQKTVQNKWLHNTSFTDMTLEEVNNSYNDFINTRYNNTPHSSLTKVIGDSTISISPYERFKQDEFLLKELSNDVIEQAFIFQDTKRINKVASFTFNKISYQVPTSLIGETVTINYNINKEVLFVTFNNKTYDVQIVNKVINSTFKRQVHL